MREWWIEQVLRHRYAVLAVGLVLTVVAGWLASQLEIDPDLRSLLPRDHPVLAALDDVETNFGPVGGINVVVEGGTPEARHAFADAIDETFSDAEGIREIDHRLETDFFVEHALYYLDDAEMEELAERMEAWQHYEFCTAAPDVCIDDPDPEAPAALQAFIDQKRSAVDENLRERTGFSDYYEREGIDALAVFIRPTESSAIIAFSIAVTDAMRQGVQDIYDAGGPWTGTDMRFNLVGPYINKADEQEVVNRDMVRTGSIALVGVILVLYLLFRSTRAVLTLLIPLLCGVTWSLGVTQLALGHLNVITSLISSVVMGIGIDAGIHFLTRARRERIHHDNETSIRRAFEGVIAPLLVASATTASAFVVMALSAFPAFGEFGVIAASGVALCLLAMVTVYPALLAVVGLAKPKRHRDGAISQATRMLLARPGLVFVALVILTVASVRGISTLRDGGFERSSRELQSDHNREVTEADVFLISEIFGRDVHASVLVIEDWEELERVYEQAQERQARRAEEGESLLDSLVAAPSLLPPANIDLDKRERRIRDLTANWSPRTWARLGGEEPDEGAAPGATNGGEAPAPGAVVGGDWDSPAGDAGWDAAANEDEGDEDGEAVDADEGWELPGGGEEWGEFEAYDAGEDAGESGEAQPEDKPEAKPEQPEAEAGPEPPAEGDALIDAEDGKLLRRMLRASTFGPDDLPKSATGMLRGDDGSWAIFAYPNYDAADMFTGVDFLEETTAYTGVDEPGVSAADKSRVYVGEPTVYATTFILLQEEWPVVMGMAALVVTAFVFWQVRSFGQTLVTLSPLLLAIWWTFGILGTFGLKLSVLNVPILPAILGIGVDNGVYLTAAIRRGPSTNTGLHRSVDETGQAILAATMTTMVGFGAFLFSDNGGLRSIGELAVIGIVATAIAAMLAVPTISALLQRRRDRLENGNGRS
ncbi:hypothetical protein PPSIR1_32352 [Plesiocystis pacifica SIR-1]|uniref:SSD domain-containing protein n=1 Tax=Plesiocystis pacifica SIR-1 TaxID=391625 RepID=A6G5K6_9BACT|nr:hypothetical protein PPSIR1_32352 [Plesiocystis pacifica SIR-1]